MLRAAPDLRTKCSAGRVQARQPIAGSCTLCCCCGRAAVTQCRRLRRGPGTCIRTGCRDGVRVGNRQIGDLRQMSDLADEARASASECWCRAALEGLRCALMRSLMRGQEPQAQSKRARSEWVGHRPLPGRCARQGTGPDTRPSLPHSQEQGGHTAALPAAFPSQPNQGRQTPLSPAQLLWRRLRDLIHGPELAWLLGPVHRSAGIPTTMEISCGRRAAHRLMTTDDKQLSVRMNAGHFLCRYNEVLG